MKIFRVLLAAAAVAGLAALAGCRGGDKEGKECGGACMAKPSGEGRHRMEMTEARIDTPTLAAMIKAGTPMTLLDARSGKYDDGRRIPGAKSLNAESSAEDVAKVVPDKGSLVVTYCTNLQCPASHKLAEHLKKLGYANVVEYPFGIEGWAAAGNAVEPKR